MEVFETRYPFIVEEYAFATDSGGPGKFRGGLSGKMVIRPVGHDCEIGGANDRSVIPPYGLFGGMPGLHGDNRVIHADGSVTEINRAGGEVAKAGDTIFFRAPGGGGYGDPLDRDLDYLQRDLENGYVSLESAERDYGAVVDKNTLNIDRVASEENRSQLKKSWQREKLFIDQKTEPFARRPFRLIGMDEEVT
jgi:N-methylhydantoinase B